MPETEKNDNELSGQIIISMINYVRKRWGERGVSDLEGDTGIKAGGIKEGMFYPLDHAGKVMAHVKDRYGPENIRKMGRFQVKDIGFKRYLARFVPPEKVLRLIRESYHKMTKVGTMGIKETKGGAEITMTDFIKNEDLVELWTGVYEGVLEMTRTKGSVETDAGELTDKGLVIFSVTWK